MKTAFDFQCDGCRETWHLSKSDLEESWTPTEICRSCEGHFCGECMRKHEREGHK